MSKWIDWVKSKRTEVEKKGVDEAVRRCHLDQRKQIWEPGEVVKDGDDGDEMQCNAYKQAVWEIDQG